MSKKRMGILMVLAALGACLAVVVAKPAQAYTLLVSTLASNPAPQPVCTINGTPAPDWHWDPVQNKCVQNAPVPGQTCTTGKDNVIVCIANPVATIGSKEVSSNDVASGKIIILEDSTVKGAVKTVKINGKNCQFFATFKNSGRDANGHVFFFIDHNGTLCRSKASPTRWVKVKGGKTGRRCFNEAAPMNSPFKVVMGIILLFKNFAHITVPLHAEAQAHVGLPTSDCYAEAHGTAGANISLTAFLKSKGDVDIHIFDSTIVKLSTSATAKINCGTPVTTTVSVTTPAPPPVTTATTNTVTTSTTTTATTTTTVTIPSPTVRLEQIQELLPNETRPICGNVKNMPASGGTLVFSVQGDATTPKGTFITDPAPSVPTGDSRICSTFQAPNATGTNQYTATLYVGGKQVDQDSLFVEIIQQTVTNPSIP